MRKDAELMPEIVDYISELRDCWQEAVAQAKVRHGNG